MSSKGEHPSTGIRAFYMQPALNTTMETKAGQEKQRLGFRPLRHLWKLAGQSH
jgi:hypothetical protein